jgi:hypothetical protein
MQATTRSRQTRGATHTSNAPGFFAVLAFCMQTVDCTAVGQWLIVVLQIQSKHLLFCVTRRMRKREARSCVDCDAVGVPQTFMTEQTLHQHELAHQLGLITFRCKSCGRELPNTTAGRMDHSQVCAGIVHRRRRAEVAGACPTCGTRFADGQSESSRVQHISFCEGRPREEAVDGMEEVRGLEEVVAVPDRVEEVPDVNYYNDNKISAGEEAFLDLGPQPEWASEKNFRHFGEQYDVHQGFTCDAMILNALRAGGHADVLNAALSILFRVLNMPQFRDAYSSGQLSKSLEVALAREEGLFGRQFREIRHNGSVCFVRDLRDVVCDLFSDIALAESFVYDNISNETQTFGGLEFERSWCFLGNGSIRRKEVAQVGAVLQPMGLWLDEGEVDDAGNPIWMIALFPLNVSPTLARRADCIFPIAYTYSASDITDCVRYLLPQLIALRKMARFVSNIQKPVVVSVEGISGDFPAVAKILMRTQVAMARAPCCSCLMEFDSSNPLRLMNDPNRWLNEKATPRTQVPL